MSKVRVTVTHREVSTFDTGDIPANLIRDLLQKNDGSFNENWSLHDVDMHITWTVESVEVEEIK